jgi:hypothetical protein
MNNRDYKTHGRKVELCLRWHVQRSAELQAQGVEATAASKQAFEEVRALGNKGLLKLWKAGKLQAA